MPEISYPDLRVNRNLQLLQLKTPGLVKATLSLSPQTKPVCWKKIISVEQDLRRSWNSASEGSFVND